MINTTPEATPAAPDGTLGRLAIENNTMRANWHDARERIEVLHDAGWTDPDATDIACYAYGLACMRAHGILEDHAPSDPAGPEAVPVVHEQHPAQHLHLERDGDLLRLSLLWCVAGAWHQAHHALTLDDLCGRLAREAVEAAPAT